MTIVKSVQVLAEYLLNKFKVDQETLQYKTTTNPDEFDSTGLPYIYCFTMPSSDLVDSYPQKCPCICITLDGRNDYEYDISFHLCISNSSLSDKEIATPVENTINTYELGDGDNYNTNADEDLLVESILFTDQVYNYLQNFTTIPLSDFTVEYPSVDLPEFPYAVSSVSCKLSINKEHIAQNPYDTFY